MSRHPTYRRLTPKKPKAFMWESHPSLAAVQYGLVWADSRRIARRKLATQGIQPDQLWCDHPRWAQHFKPLNKKKIMRFLSQLTHMLTRGIALTHAFHLLYQPACPGLKRLIILIEHDISNGQSLSDSLQKFPRHFSVWTLKLIHVGEKTDALHQTLHHIIQDQNRRQQAKSQRQKALLYPGIILCAGGIIFAIMVIFILPQFKGLFGEMGQKLPKITLWLIELRALLCQRSGAIFCLTVILVVFVRFALKWLNSFEHTQVWVERLPWWGTWQKWNQWCVIFFVLHIGYITGVDLVASLKLVCYELPNKMARKKILDMIDYLHAGKNLSEGMRLIQWFPQEIPDFIAVGENCDDLGTILETIYQDLQKKCRDLLDRIGAMLEPIALLLVAALVGTAVVALYFPIFQMGNHL